jgi:hypothetical protein
MKGGKIKGNLNDLMAGCQEILLANASRLVPSLGVLAVLGKTAVGLSYRSVHPSVWNNSSPTGFSEFLLFDFLKSLREFQD